MGNALAAIGSGLSRAASGVGRALSGGAGTALGNTLSEVVVTAPRVLAPSLGSVAGSALAGGLGSAALNNALKPSTPQQPKPANQNDTEVAPIDVVAPRPAPSSLMSSVLPALGAGATALSSMPSAASFGNISPAAPAPAPAPGMANLGNDTPVSEIEVTAPRRELDLSGLTGFMAGGGGQDQLGGAVDTDTLTDPTLEEDVLEEGDATDAGLLGLLGALGLSGKDLLGMGLLAAVPGLLDQGGGGGTGTPTGNLEEIAKNNTNLANMLSQKAQAGMNGQIGGQGMNSIRRMVRRAQAAIRQRYAGMGMSGSSAETQDLNAAAQAGVDMQFDIGQKMATTGLQAVASLTGQSANVYAALLNAQTQKDTQLGNALANFAGAVAGRLFK